ncbi:MAG: RNA polymerase sigma factor [Verrucomicrobia bacterium]|jgi:RNA polymerase sigma-70 factor (ECF subfamily)|nr:RNA polymerase sigma factor [Verrucomicrobiota bacterium]
MVKSGDNPGDLRDLAAAWRGHGDEAAARELMARLYPQVIAIVRRHLPRRAAEEDLAQEIFVKLFANLDRYNPALPLENWVSRLSLNTCLDKLRAESRRPELRWADMTEEQTAVLENLFAVDAASADTETQKPGSQELFQRLLDTLNAADRMVITLLMLEEKSVAEIAKQTGWSKTLVKVRAFRARLKLKRALAELEKSKT